MVKAMLFFCFFRRRWIGSGGTSGTFTAGAPTRIASEGQTVCFFWVSVEIWRWWSKPFWDPILVGR